MKHKSIPKNIRERVYRKYKGHCAYCGCELDYKDMQVDHVHSVYAESLENDSVDDPNINQDDSFENLMPSCRQCNFYKSASNIDEFRDKISNWLESTCMYSFQVKLAMKYGILEYKPWDRKFYFEKIDCDD